MDGSRRWSIAAGCSALTAAGFAFARVDLAGSGDSDGLLRDEYLASEHDDAIEVIAWLADQPWCNGKVGMRGLSWSGFNALQVAARRPPALACRGERVLDRRPLRRRRALHGRLRARVRHAALGDVGAHVLRDAA